MSFTVKNKTILVTGANQGLGEALVKKLAYEKANIIFTTKNSRHGKEILQMLQDIHPDGQFSHVELNLADPQSIYNYTLRLGKSKQDIDILVNTAAVSNDFDQIMNVNVVGTLAFTDAVLPKISIGGSIIMVSSIAGQLNQLPRDFQDLVEDITSINDTIFKNGVNGIPKHLEFKGTRQEGYALSKALLNKAVQLMAQEDYRLQQKDISITSVHPGSTDVEDNFGHGKGDENAEAGAESIYWNIINTNKKTTGRFFHNGKNLTYV